MEIGVVAVKAINSNYYLAMNKKGKLYGSVSILILFAKSTSVNYHHSFAIQRPPDTEELCYHSIASKENHRGLITRVSRVGKAVLPTLQFPLLFTH